MLTSGVLNICGTYLIEKTVVYESLLSDFLFNVYINELDKFVEKLGAEDYCASIFLKKEVNSGNLSKIKRSMLFTKAFRVSHVYLFCRRKVQRKYYYKACKINSFFSDINYVRYGDHFLIGVINSKLFAATIKAKVDQFVKSDLHLDIKKNSLVNRYENVVTFLGFVISFYTF